MRRINICEEMGSGIEAKNTAMVSRIIKETLEDKRICIYDESVGTKARTYVPWWAK